MAGFGLRPWLFPFTVYDRNEVGQAISSSPRPMCVKPLHHQPQTAATANNNRLRRQQHLHCTTTTTTTTQSKAHDLYVTNKQRRQPQTTNNNGYNTYRGAPRGGGEVQRSRALGRGGERVRTSLQQEEEGGGVPPPAREHQGPRAVLVCGLHLTLDRPGLPELTGLTRYHT